MRAVVVESSQQMLAVFDEGAGGGDLDWFVAAALATGIWIGGDQGAGRNDDGGLEAAR